jgi:uridine kinase
VGAEIFALLDDTVALVAVDGVDGAGKSVFADELAAVLHARGVAVIRASIDGFHNPPSIRYARGRSSPEGFYLDSYDYDAVRRLLLDPLARHGDRRIVRAIYDVLDERPVARAVELWPVPGVLVFDGIFLHREELREYWDYSIFLDVDFLVSVPRGASRGRGNPDPHAEVNRRYVEGQGLYLRECRPRRDATIVIDNTTFEAAHITSRNAPNSG